MARLDEEHNWLGKFWENFEISDETSIEKLNLYLFLGKFVAKIIFFGNNIIFLQQFFLIGGAVEPLSTLRMPLVWMNVWWILIGMCFRLKRLLILFKTDIWIFSERKSLTRKLRVKWRSSIQIYKKESCRSQILKRVSHSSNWWRNISLIFQSNCCNPTGIDGSFKFLLIRYLGKNQKM